MGLNKRNEKVTYVKIKDGKFYTSDDKAHENPSDELEGVITNLNFREDEWEGQKIEKLIVTVSDGTEDFNLSVGFDSSFATSLIGFLKNADLSKPLTLIPLQRTEKDGKTTRSILVKQGGKFMKQYYTKDHPNGLPRINQVMAGNKPLLVNGRAVWDKTDFLEFYRKVVKNELKPGSAEGYVAPAPAKTSEQHAEHALSDAGDVIDDLPF